MQFCLKLVKPQWPKQRPNNFVNLYPHSTTLQTLTAYLGIMYPGNNIRYRIFRHFQFLDISVSPLEKCRQVPAKKNGAVLGVNTNVYLIAKCMDQ